MWRRSKRITALLLALGVLFIVASIILGSLPSKRKSEEGSSSEELFLSSTTTIANTPTRTSATTSTYTSTTKTKFTPESTIAPETSTEHVSSTSKGASMSTMSTKSKITSTTETSPSTGPSTFSESSSTAETTTFSSSFSSTPISKDASITKSEVTSTTETLSTTTTFSPTLINEITPTSEASSTIEYSSSPISVIESTSETSTDTSPSTETSPSTDFSSSSESSFITETTFTSSIPISEANFTTEISFSTASGFTPIHEDEILSTTEIRSSLTTSSQNPITIPISSSTPLSETESTTEETTLPTPTSTRLTMSTQERPLINSSHNTTLCHEPVCNYLASKVDHGQDKCKNFYEYVCSGSGKDEQLPPTTVEDEIKDRLKRQQTNPKTRTMASDFYDSCLNQRETFVESQGIKAARDLLDQLNEKLISAKDSLTEVIQFLLERQLNPFFEVTLEVDEYSLEYVPVLRYALYESVLSEHVEKTICLEELGEVVMKESFQGDLDMAYKNYTNCYSAGRGLEAKIKRIQDSCRIFFPEDESDACLRAQSIYKHIIEDMFSDLPNLKVPKMKKARRLEESECVSITELFMDIEPDRMIEWSMLFSGLFKSHRGVRNICVLYGHGEELLNAVFILDDEFKSNAEKVKDFYRIMVAERLYAYLVNPLNSSDAEDYCLEVMQELLPKESVDFLVESFTSEEKKIAKRIIENSLGILTNLGLEAYPIIAEEGSTAVFPSDEVDHSTFDYSQNVLRLLHRNQDIAFSFVHKIENQTTRLYVGDAKLSDYKVSFGEIEIPVRALMEPNMYLGQKIPDYMNMAGAARIIIPQVVVNFAEDLKNRRGGMASWPPLDFGCGFPPKTAKFLMNTTTAAGVHLDIKFQVDDKILSDLRAEVETIELMLNGTFSDFPEGEEQPMVSISKGNHSLTPKEVFVILVAKTHCNSLSLPEEILQLVEEGNLPSRIRLNAMAELMSADFSQVLGCEPPADRHRNCPFAEEEEHIAMQGS